MFTMPPSSKGRRLRFLRCLFGGLWVFAAAAWAAPPAPDVAPLSARPIGMPLLKNFNPEDYGGYPQNWAVVQDARGIIYVGNGDDGVLEFDGTQWRHIAVPRQSTVRSLATDARGRVYVGCVGDFGYLAPDAAGRMHYVSLLDRIPPEDRDFADVWNVLPGDDGIYFATSSRLFHLASGKVRVWKAQTEFHLAYYLDHQLYIQQMDQGLEKLVAGRLERVEGGARFATDRIYAMVPWDEAGKPASILIGSRQAGWLIFDGHAYRPWSPRSAEALKADQIYGAQWLADGRLAVATLQGGVMLLDRQGDEVGRVGMAEGLIGDTVYGMMQDRDAGLWLALDNGLARVEVGSPLTRFTRMSGLDGSVMAIHRHGRTLYAGTAKGLFRLDETKARFTRVAGIHGQVWDMLDMDGSLLVASAQGLFEVDGNRAARQLSREFSFTLARVAPHDDRLLAGQRDGLLSMRFASGRLVDEGKVVAGEIHSLLADAAGTLWIGFMDEGAARLDLSGQARPATSPRMERLQPSVTHPEEPRFVTLGLINGDIRFGTASGIQKLDASGRALVPDERFSGLFGSGTRQVWKFEQDAFGSVWMYTVDPARHLKALGVAVADAQGRYHWQERPLQALSGKTVFALTSEPDGVIWVGTNDGLYRHDPHRQKDYATPAATLLRNVATHGGKLLWGGAGRVAPAELDWRENSLRFDYAQPDFEMGAAERYQVMLEGMDNTWSAWTNETYRDYTNLPEGSYRFRVRARDAYGGLGSEANFSFRVLPPWYRSWWAYLTWCALLLLVAKGAMRWRLRTLRRRNQALTKLVEERTEALECANSALVDQTITDALTGLRNRRYVIDHVDKDIATVQRNYRNLALGYADHADANINLLFLMMDLDHFKEVNDRYGHAAGDRVLAQLRDILVAATRETDTPVRWGGEEFLIVARFANNAFGPVVADRIRTMVADHPFDLGNGLTIHRTCSVGFASYPVFAASKHNFGWEDVVNLADQCLYRAKRDGRNRWVGVVPTDAALATDPGEITVDLDVLVAKGYLSVLSLDDVAAPG